MLTTFVFHFVALANLFLVLTSGSAVPQDVSARTVDNVDSLVARDAKLPPYCVPVPGQPWSFADGAAINDGISYLNGLDVPCSAGPGPGNCVRVSCSWNSAIKLCNDNGYEISFSCSIVAQRVQQLITACAIYPPHTNYLIGGQIFDTDGWNVVVYDDSC